MVFRGCSSTCLGLFPPWQGQTFQAHYFMNQRLEPEREGQRASPCLEPPGPSRWPAASQAHAPPPPSGRKGLLLTLDLWVGHSTSGLPEAPAQGLILESQVHRWTLMPSEVTDLYIPQKWDFTRDEGEEAVKNRKPLPLGEKAARWGTRGGRGSSWPLRGAGNGARRGQWEAQQAQVRASPPRPPSLLRGKDERALRRHPPGQVRTGQPAEQ